MAPPGSELQTAETTPEQLSNGQVSVLWDFRDLRAQQSSRGARRLAQSVLTGLPRPSIRAGPPIRLHSRGNHLPMPALRSHLEAQQ